MPQYCLYSVEKVNSWWWDPWSSKHVEWRTTNREIKDSPEVSSCWCLFWNNYNDARNHEYKIFLQLDVQQPKIWYIMIYIYLVSKLIHRNRFYASSTFHWSYGFNYLANVLFKWSHKSNFFYCCTVHIASLHFYFTNTCICKSHNISVNTLIIKKIKH